MRRPSSLERSDDRTAGEAGVTVLELVITSALLLAALATVLSGLYSTTEASTYATTRSNVLDDLRVMAADFSKDARAGSRVTSFGASSVTLETYRGGVLTTVTWQASGDRLSRVEDGDERVYVIDLTSTAVFSYYGETRAPMVNRIRMSLATRPDQRRPAIDVETNVELRNV